MKDKKRGKSKLDFAISVLKYRWAEFKAVEDTCYLKDEKMREITEKKQSLEEAIKILEARKDGKS